MAKLQLKRGKRKEINMEQEIQNENVETETTATEQVETNSENVVEKTFTQDEVNAIVKERLAKAQKNAPSKEDLAKYSHYRNGNLFILFCNKE